MTAAGAQLMNWFAASSELWRNWRDAGEGDNEVVPKQIAVTGP